MGAGGGRARGGETATRSGDIGPVLGGGLGGGPPWVVTRDVGFGLTRRRSRAQPGQKKSFLDWLLEKSVRDSSVIGAGYEDDLKSGQYKPKGGLNISEGGSFKI